MESKISLNAFINCNKTITFRTVMLDIFTPSEAERQATTDETSQYRHDRTAQVGQAT